MRTDTEMKTVIARYRQRAVFRDLEKITGQIQTLTEKRDAAVDELITSVKEWGEL